MSWNNHFISVIIQSKVIHILKSLQLSPSIILLINLNDITVSQIKQCLPDAKIQVLNSMDVIEKKPLLSQPAPDLILLDLTYCSQHEAQAVLLFIQETMMLSTFCILSCLDHNSREIIGKQGQQGNFSYLIDSNTVIQQLKQDNSVFFTYQTVDIFSIDYPQTMLQCDIFYLSKAQSLKSRKRMLPFYAEGIDNGSLITEEFIKEKLAETNDYEIEKEQRGLENSDNDDNNESLKNEYSETSEANIKEDNPSEFATNADNETDITSEEQKLDLEMEAMKEIKGEKTTESKLELNNEDINDNREKSEENEESYEVEAEEDVEEEAGEEAGEEANLENSANEKNAELEPSAELPAEKHKIEFAENMAEEVHDEKPYFYHNLTVDHTSLSLHNKDNQLHQNKEMVPPAAQFILQHAELIKAHIEELKQHTSTHASILEMLQKNQINETERKEKLSQLKLSQDKHKEVLESYKKLVKQHQVLLDNFINQQMKILEQHPHYTDKYHEIIDRHKQFIKQTNDILDEHQSYLDNIQ